MNGATKRADINSHSTSRDHSFPHSPSSIQTAAGSSISRTIVDMKTEVLNGLLTARTLFDTARLQCFVRDRHVASAGLVVLQDALELVLYACLLEIDADEQKAIESFTFDQLIGEFRQRQLPIAKSGTLKAMNKQRVLIKHHAQLAEPAAVRNYYDASLNAANELLKAIVGKRLNEIVIADIITDSHLRGHIEDAAEHIESRSFMDAMISIRKALFLAVESDYDIREWAAADSSTLPFSGLFRKHKAPYFTRNKEWIAENVKTPTDYIQLDHERVRVDLMELGIATEEFFNVWRLTPSVYPLENARWA